jgi:hypothetical protein
VASLQVLHSKLRKGRTTMYVANKIRSEGKMLMDSRRVFGPLWLFLLRASFPFSYWISICGGVTRKQRQAFRRMRELTTGIIRCNVGLRPGTLEVFQSALGQTLADLFRPIACLLAVHIMGRL